jgi:hypothetical protein
MSLMVRRVLERGIGHHFDRARRARDLGGRLFGIGRARDDDGLVGFVGCEYGRESGACEQQAPYELGHFS